MMRYGLLLEYCGDRFCGWQYQLGCETVQGLIESSLYSMWGEEVRVIGAGRTDSGVHATGQVAHLDLNRKLEPRTLMMALNHKMSERGCVVRACSEVRDDFHARFSARGRRYVYRILRRLAPPALERGRVYHYYRDLNLEDMREAAGYLLGKHDFASFRASGCQAKDSEKSLDCCDIEQRGEEIHITVMAPSFLYRQVRIIVGTLLEVGRGEQKISWVKEVLEKKERKYAGPTAPACGLTLTNVFYSVYDCRFQLFSVDKPISAI